MSGGQFRGGAQGRGGDRHRGGSGPRDRGAGAPGRSSMKKRDQASPRSWRGEGEGRPGQRRWEGRGDSQHRGYRRGQAGQVDSQRDRHGFEARGAAKKTHGALVDDARRVSLEALRQVRENDAYANLILPGLITSAHLGRRDAAFATALTYGTLRLQGRYDAILSHCTDRPLDEIDPVVLDVLRLGAHQLLGMRVASHGAVSATVNLATAAAGRKVSGFVNAVLRRVSERNLEEWREILASQQPGEAAVDALARLESHPVWIVKAMRQALAAYGRESELEALLAADNSEPAVALCARPGLITPEELAYQVARRNPDTPALHGERSPYAVILPGGDPGRLPALREGRAGVEDEGSQLVAALLAAAPLEGRDEAWLDMCAGPGGKAALLGAVAQERGAHLTANEVSEHRAELVRENLRALDPGTVEVRCGDGRDFATAYPGTFDRVLIDAPCSGLGSLRRRPEARWRRQASDAADLARVQRELLASAVTALRVGGVAAYVTCSPHLLETSLAVRDARKKLSQAGIETELLHAGALAGAIAPQPPAGVSDEMLQLWPHTDGTDAMFCALLRRTL